MPLARIAIFAGLSAKQKRSRSRFKECTRTCRKDAPSSTAYPSCLRSCLTTKTSKSRQRRKRK